MAARVADDEAGFTLIELLVTVLIVGILLGIAIPTFLGAQDRARDRRAHSNLRNAATAQATHYAEHQQFTVDPAMLESVEPALDWTSEDATANGVLPTGATTVQDDGVDRDGDGSYNCNVSTSNGVTTAEGDCAVAQEGLVCLTSRSASGARFVLALVATGPDAGAYYGKDVACPADGVFGSEWSRAGW